MRGGALRFLTACEVDLVLLNSSLPDRSSGRYREHPVDVGDAERAPRYGVTGRPEHLYAWRRRPGPR